MPKLERILVPVEFSPRCRGAVQYAEALSCHFHCEIVLLHVITPPPPNLGAFGSTPHTGPRDFEHELMEARMKALQDLCCNAPDGVPVNRAVMQGDPTPRIVDYAAREQCDLVVMPTRAYGPFRRLLLGSVTAKVLHDAVCPVLTGPHMEDAPDYARFELRNVVCAVNLEAHTRQVLCWGAGFAREFGAKLWVVHAIPAQLTRMGSFFFDPECHDRMLRAARDRLEFLRYDMQIEADEVIEDGAAPAVVTAAARNLHADLLVIGRGSTPRAHGHLPANSYAIVRESPCPVVTI